MFALLLLSDLGPQPPSFGGLVEVRPKVGVLLKPKALPKSEALHKTRLGSHVAVAPPITPYSEDPVHPAHSHSQQEGRA